MAVTLGAGGAWHLAGRALRGRALLLPVLLVQAPLMAVAVVAACCALAVFVISPVLALAEAFAPGVVGTRHAVLLTDVERARFALLLLTAAAPWMLLQAVWRAGLLAAADRQLRDGQAGPDDWLHGMATWALALAARRALALVVTVALLLAALLALARMGQPAGWFWLPVLAAALTLQIFWSRAVGVQPAAMVADDQDLISALPRAAWFGTAAKGPLAGLGCLADVTRLGCVAPGALVLALLVVRFTRHGLGPVGLLVAALVLGLTAAALAWLDARRCVATLVLYRGRGGADGDSALATQGCRVPRPAEPRAPSPGLTVASAPDGELWLPGRPAGGLPPAAESSATPLDDEPAL